MRQKKNEKKSRLQGETDKKAVTKKFQKLKNGYFFEDSAS